jgi:hypothetical protein
MMGLGSKIVQQRLLHPDHAHLLRRADENLLDLVLLGAIASLGLGTLIWFLMEPAPPMIIGSYNYREPYLLFFNGIFLQFLFFILCHWILDSSRTWPRIAIFLVGALCGITIGLVKVLELEVLSHKIAFALLATYSFSVAALSARQLTEIARNVEKPL